MLTQKSANYSILTILNCITFFFVWPEKYAFTVLKNYKKKSK